MKDKYLKLFDEHIAALKNILAALAAKDADFAALLENEKKALGEKSQSADIYGSEYYYPAIYNALATICEAPEQVKANAQLRDCIVCAKEELAALREALCEA